MPSPALVSTKYAPPPVRDRLVHRPDLAAALETSRRLVLVSAPPGYGKTTLVAAWLAATAARAAWLTLDPSDDDPAVFVAYLVATIRRACPGLDPVIEESAISAPETPASLGPLVNALGESREPLVIVLDDYQAIRSGRIHDLVAFLVRHLPTVARVVIVSREDPPLPLSRARARGELTELRAGDLRFSPPDAARFLRETMGLDVSDEATQRLAEQTEGWIAGLQLAGLSLRGHADPARFVAEFSGTDRYVLDYLVDEALARQPPAVRAFLEASSILGRLSGPLCDALTGRSDGAEMLARLEAANVFLTPLDDRREWYRLHRLFADLLRSTMTPTAQAALHAAAAAWLAMNGDRPAAIRHALAAHDPELASTLIEEVADETLARGEFATLIGWGEELPRATLIGRPAARVAIALARFFRGDFAAAEEEVRSLRATARALDPATDGRIVCLEAWLANRADRADAAALARRAIELIPETDAVVRSLAFGTLGEALVGSDVDGAIDAHEEARRLASHARRSTLELGSIYSLAMAELTRGRRRDAEDRCRSAINECADGTTRVTPAIGVVHLALGAVLFEADELAEARSHIATGTELCERAGLRAAMLGASEWVEVLGRHLLGDADGAWRTLEATRRRGERVGLARVVTATRLLAAELLLREGNPQAARHRLEAAPLQGERLLGVVRDRSRQTTARVHIALNQPADALQILEPLADEQRSCRRLGRLISTLSLIAGARESQRDVEGAVLALSEAVRLAAAEAYRRPFLDPGAPTVALLGRVRSINPEFVGDLIARSRPAAARRNGKDTGDELPVEPLSTRELEILRLVAGGLTNDEIGRALFITTGTAKWHVHNLIGKLGGHDRVSMLVVARSAGLL